MGWCHCPAHGNRYALRWADEALSCPAGPSAQGSSGHSKGPTGLLMARKGMLQPPAGLTLSDCCPSQGLGPANHIQYGQISCLTGQVTGKPDPALAYKGRSGSQRTRWPALPKRAPSINKFRDAVSPNRGMTSDRSHQSCHTQVIFSCNLE